MSKVVKLQFGWEKVCGHCKKSFHVKIKDGLSVFFHADSSRIDSFASRCKQCESRVKRGKNYGHSSVKKKRNPISHRAQTKLNNAIASGKIKRGKCRDCDAIKTHGHHTDYTKPLDVIWLCQKHHVEEHRRIKNVR